MDPTNPRVLYAGFWQIEIKTWGRTSGGAGSGIWKSTDGGTTWKRLTGHRPADEDRRQDQTRHQQGESEPHLRADRDGRRRADAGREADRQRPPLPLRRRRRRRWQLVSNDLQMAGRTHYYNRMGVSPDNANEAYFLSANCSEDARRRRPHHRSAVREIAGRRPSRHLDRPDERQPHAREPRRRRVGHDQPRQVVESGRSCRSRRCTTSTVDNRIPYNVYGNRQDGPSAMVPSNARTGDSSTRRFPTIMPRGMWSTVGGGESGWATPDTVDGNLVWSSASGSGSIGGIVTRYDRADEARADGGGLAAGDDRVGRRTASSIASCGRRRSRSARTITTCSTSAASTST